ncbi:MAG: hypothetical protein U9P90_00830 [Patescibacteria group bacterium]|nr:hypothetical protein [Patescibacteria group bacterium]
MSKKRSSQEKFVIDASKEEEVTPENMEVKKELERAKIRLHDSFDTLLNSRMGGSYAKINEEGYSGDGASIYVLTFLKNKKGEETPELVQIGWGEFSKETFESDRYPAFRDIPFDVYCVSQSDSYFADEQLREEMAKNPVKYLSEHSIFVASNGRVKLSEQIDSHNRRLDKDINAVPYDEMLRIVRNQIIKERSTPEEFAHFLRELPDDPEELGRYMSDLEHRVDWMSDRELKTVDKKTRADVKKKRLMHCLWGMGVERVGIAVGDKKAMESVLALKKHFDFETNSFLD